MKSFLALTCLVSTLAACLAGGEGNGAIDTDAAATEPTPDAETQTEVEATVSNAPEICEHSWMLIPYEEDNHNFVATYVEPPSYPFTFESFEYKLGGGAGCVRWSTHAVFAYAEAGVKPAQTPSEHPSYQVFEGGTESTDYTVARKLDPPLVVEQGGLVIGLRLDSIPAFSKSCPEMCSSSESKPGTNYRSGGTGEPFNWEDTVTLYEKSQLRIYAKGFGYQ